MLFHPLIQISSRHFSRLKRVCRTQTLTSTERHLSSLHSHCWKCLSAARQKREILAILHHNKLIIINFKIFSSYQFRRDSSTIRVQMLTKLISIGSYSPEIRAFGLLLRLLIRECGSTLYVGLARAVPPTNTNFRLTFFY